MEGLLLAHGLKLPTMMIKKPQTQELEVTRSRYIFSQEAAAQLAPFTQSDSSLGNGATHVQDRPSFIARPPGRPCRMCFYSDPKPSQVDSDS